MSKTTTIYRCNLELAQPELVEYILGLERQLIKNGHAFGCDAVTLMAAGGGPERCSCGLDDTLKEARDHAP